MKIMEFLLEIRQQLRMGADDYAFSCWIEDTLYDNYLTFEKENPTLALEMNGEMINICEQMEPGMKSDKFYDELSEEVNRLLAAAHGVNVSFDPYYGKTVTLETDNGKVFTGYISDCIPAHDNEGIELVIMDKVLPLDGVMYDVGFEPWEIKTIKIVEENSTAE